uniref:Uncharacterized protein n=1 Tax=Siphoviridae sp. ctWDo30 TaxID=2826360 RepID=A0A8S5N6I7_9CAUD|nr:MAG TPA: hypothetical protein [Siphoviridae sp. ctWDo30]
MKAISGRRSLVDELQNTAKHIKECKRRSRPLGEPNNYNLSAGGGQKARGIQR